MLSSSLPLACPRFGHTDMPPFQALFLMLGATMSGILLSRFARLSLQIVSMETPIPCNLLPPSPFFPPHDAPARTSITSHPFQRCLISNRDNNFLPNQLIPA